MDKFLEELSRVAFISIASSMSKDISQITEENIDILRKIVEYQTDFNVVEDMQRTISNFEEAINSPLIAFAKNMQKRTMMMSKPYLEMISLQKYPQLN